MKHLSATLVAFLIGVVVLAAGIDDEAIRLRNLGLAELENEQPGKAEQYFRELVELVPGDPLPGANLAIAALRQQRFDDAAVTIDRTLAQSPDRPELLAIQAEILQWSGRPEAALPIFVAAADKAPDNVEIQYALLRQATSLGGEEADQAKAAALARLRELRPENLVVLLQLGQQRLAAGDRTGATDAFLRIREVLWQAQPAATQLMDQILTALETGDLEAARVPALRLENVVKITPMFKEGLRELSPGIQGVPLTRFENEPPAIAFGDPRPARFTADAVSDIGTIGRGLAVGDFDDDGQTDWVRLTGQQSGTLEVWLASSAERPTSTLSAGGTQVLTVADLDNDGRLDLIAAGTESLFIFRGLGDGSFEEATAAFGLEAASGSVAAVLDFDIEGDLDLVTAGDSLALYRNTLQGPLESVGDRSLPALGRLAATDLVASDLDRDGDVDLLLATQDGLVWLDNLRQGEFVDHTEAGGLKTAAGARAVTSADFDNDGLPDLAMVDSGVRFFHNLGGRFAPWPIAEKLRSSAELDTIRAFDANNDGRLDLAIAGPDGFAIATQGDDLEFVFARLEQAPPAASAVVDLDLDGDCDVDLLVGSEQGLWRLENRSDTGYHCLTVRLQGLDKGSSKNNIFGFGSTIEIRSGEAYQFREVTTDLTHLGLGASRQADLMRVVWTNGVPQNRLQPQAQQRIVEEQVLKGSCPFVYARHDDGVRFVTDLLWGAPIGLPVGPGQWASTDPQELVELPGVAAIGGEFDLRITEELWEAAYFDHVQLWVVDHPADVEVASSLRIVPGRQVDDRVLATRALRPPAAAIADGVDITDRVHHRDEVYASPWRESPYQGVAAAPWSLVIDLGQTPAAAVRLHLDSWIFPSDASLNLALAQQRTYRMEAPRLEVETDSGWQVLMPEMGFPAGKTKTMVVDTPPLPPGSQRLRIVGTQWLSFDRIAWSTERADSEPVVRARLTPTSAELRFRGFSKMYRSAPNGPHYFDYAEVESESPWLPFPGRYTRYGDVRELLEQPDDRSVVLGPGDEMSLLFDARTLPPIPRGWRRTVFLESHGWDKDADRNTGAGQQVEPLPFRAMTGYPYGSDETVPDTPLYRDYLQGWQTREIGPSPGAPTGSF